MTYISDKETMIANKTKVDKTYVTLLNILDLFIDIEKNNLTDKIINTEDLYFIKAMIELYDECDRFIALARTIDKYDSKKWNTLSDDCVAMTIVHKDTLSRMAKYVADNT